MRKDYYYYDSERLKMIKVKWFERYRYSLLGILYVLVSIIISYATFSYLRTNLETLKTLEIENKQLVFRSDSLKNVISIINETDKFSESELLMMINGLNLMYPEVVLAQSKLETGNYTSDVFKVAGNLFGMKPARIRPYTHYGIYKDHADYLGNWRLSVIDYALWQSREVSKSNVKSVEDYLTLLKIKGYAEDDNYIQKLRELIPKDSIN